MATMFPSHSSAWTASDIEQVFATNYKEGRHIDYKQTLTTNPVDLATDVSAFANTDGGVILYGISDDDGYPKECVGLNIDGEDKEQLRMEAVLQTNLDPPMRGCKFDWITTGDGKLVLALRVPQSAYAPHMVTKNSRNFYARGEAGNAPLGWFELKNAFGSHGLSSMRFTEFVAGRCVELARKNGSFPMIPGGYAVLHLMPVSAITRPLDISVPELRVALKDISPPNTAGSWGTRIYMDGAAVIAGADDAIFSFVHLFRDGTIEVATPCEFENQSGRGLSPMYLLALDSKIESYVKSAESVGVIAPWMASLTLIGCHGLKAYARAWSANGSARAIDADYFRLPPQEWIDDNDWSGVLRKFADRLANYFGMDRSPYYGPDGKLRHDAFQ